MADDLVTVDCKIRVRGRGSSAHIVTHDMRLDVSRMVAWIITHPEAARCLLPRYNELSADMQAIADHAEGSAKNHGVQP